MVAGIFEHIEAEAMPEGTLRIVAVPRDAWRPFFACLVLEGETGFEPAGTKTRAVTVWYRLQRVAPISGHQPS